MRVRCSEAFRLLSKQTVYSTCWESANFSPRRICLFSPLKAPSVVIESNTNRNICSMKNTKIKSRRACKLLFTKKQAKEKSWSVHRSPIRSLCASHGYEPTPRLFRTRIALLCKNDVALASPTRPTLTKGAPGWERGQAYRYQRNSRLAFEQLCTVIIPLLDETSIFCWSVDYSLPSYHADSIQSQLCPSAN